MIEQTAQAIDLSKLYWIVGAMIVMNFGTIISIFIAAGRALWWIAKLDSRVEKNTKDVNFAHQSIRDLKNGLQ